MVVEVQAINYILDNGIRGFKAEWFCDYRTHFDYIYGFTQKYGRVPDKVTFVDKFKDFKCFKVSDPLSSIIDRLKEDARYKKIVPIYNKAADLFTAGKSDEACKLLAESIAKLEKELSPGLPPVNLSDPAIKKMLYKQLKTGVTKFSTSRAELDANFGGWNTRDYIVIFARLGIGKSWIAEFFAYNLVKEGLRVGYYSGEMSAAEVSLRLDTFNTNQSNSKMFNGNFTEDEYEKVADEFSKLKGQFIILTPEEIGDGATVADLKRFIETQNLQALFIDQISLMKRNSRLSAPEAISQLANDLRLLQATTNIPFFIVSQQNRAALQDKESKGKDDLVATISYSDALGQNATLAFYLDYKPETKILSLDLVKSRRSRPEKFSYVWNIDQGTLRYIPITEDDGSPVENDDYYQDDEEQPF